MAGQRSVRKEADTLPPDQGLTLALQSSTSHAQAQLSFSASAAFSRHTGCPPCSPSSTAVRLLAPPRATRGLGAAGPPPPAHPPWPSRPALGSLALPAGHPPASSNPSLSSSSSRARLCPLLLPHGPEPPLGLSSSSRSTGPSLGAGRRQGHLHGPLTRSLPTSVPHATCSIAVFFCSWAPRSCSSSPPAGSG